jgi:hypothetical protein
LRGKVAIGWPNVTQNRSAAAEYQAAPEQSRQIADAEPPEATNLALWRQSFARGSRDKSLPAHPELIYLVLPNAFSTSIANVPTSATTAFSYGGHTSANRLRFCLRL